VACVTEGQQLDIKLPGMGDLRERQDELFTERAAQSPYLAPPIRSVLGPIVTLTKAEGRPRGGPRVGRIFGREGALDHI
jgi:hypothetical protein